MPSHVEVKNFARFQHYKDRNPPWIKLYNELLDDYEFGRLPDASKWLAIGIWLLASRYDNRIPNDPEWIGRRINANTAVDLSPLLSAGFITVVQNASEPLAGCPVSATPEVEVEGETEREEEKGAAVEEELEEETPRPPLDKTAYALGEFCRTTGCVWPNKTPIAEWSATLDAEPAFAGLDIPLEIRSCADWHVSNHKIPKAPGPTIRNWLKNARQSAARSARPDGGGGGRTFKQVEADCKALLRAAGNMVLVEVARGPIFERLAKEFPGEWERSGDVFQRLDFPPLVKAANEYAQSETMKGQLERLSGHRRSA